MTIYQIGCFHFVTNKECYRAMTLLVCYYKLISIHSFHTRKYSSTLCVGMGQVQNGILCLKYMSEIHDNESIALQSITCKDLLDSVVEMFPGFWYNYSMFQ